MLPAPGKTPPSVSLYSRVSEPLVGTTELVALPQRMLFVPNWLTRAAPAASWLSATWQPAMTLPTMKMFVVLSQEMPKVFP